VLDFGIAKVIIGDETVARPTAFTSFTPFYAAPEQFDPRIGATGLHTDVYAFALVFVEVLTGRPPVDGRELMQVAMEATDASRRPTPRGRGATVPDAVEAVFARALSVDPRARHATLEQMWDALVKAVTPSNQAATLEIPSIGQRGARVRTQAMPSSSAFTAAKTVAAHTAALPAAHAQPAPIPEPPAAPWGPPPPPPRPYVWGPPPAPSSRPGPNTSGVAGTHWAVWAGVGFGGVIVFLVILIALLR
jgi:serine/threonine-protein kinase